MTGGVLAIWFDCVPEAEAALEDWYQSEHLAERMAVPGFRAARRFESLGNGPRHMTTYEVDGPEVLRSPAYVARITDPTPWTRDVMTNMVTGMNRTICTRQVLHGESRGGVAAVARLPSAEGAADVATALWNPVKFARIELWTGEETAPVLAEEQLRGGDTRIGACLHAEALRAEDAIAAAKIIVDRLPGAETGVYQLLSVTGEAG